jgi:MOSC domain-containing protein YiiM
MSASGTVVAVHCSPRHEFTKTSMPSIRLLAGLGVDGDAHCGTTVKHRSRVAKDPTQPNLRQVHVVASELHDLLATEGFSVAPGDIGENVTTRGIDVLSLPVGTRMSLGDDAVIELTGARNPCRQLNGFQQGLLDAVRVRGVGAMAIVVTGGIVRAGDVVRVELPRPPHLPLARV